MLDPWGEVRGRVKGAGTIENKGMVRLGLGLGPVPHVGLGAGFGFGVSECQCPMPCTGAPTGAYDTLAVALLSLVQRVKVGLGSGLGLGLEPGRWPSRSAEVCPALALLVQV